MVNRVYSEKEHSRKPRYKEVRISEDWHSFSNFRKWMVLQAWENKELDKDLLGDGTLYSKDTCCFLPSYMNKFMMTGGSNKLLPIGVRISSKNGKYESRINDPFENKQRHLGYFDCPTKASLAYKIKKLEYATRYSRELEDNLAVALINRFNQ